MKQKTTAETADPELTRLRAMWGRCWYVWRSRHGEAATGAWCGTLKDDEAGVFATVTADSADELDDELAYQAVLAEAVKGLVVALNGRAVMSAEPDGNLVRVTHHTTGRCDTVALTHEDLTWIWLSGSSREPIGRPHELPEVVRKIRERLGTPFRA